MFVQAATAQPHVPAGLLATACLNAKEPVARTSALAAGAALFLEGDKAADVYELISGVVRLSKTLPDGRRQIVGFVFPGEIFTSSGFAFGEGGAASCTADAVTPTRVAAYRRNSLDRLLAERPGLARDLLAASSRCLFRAQQQMLLLGRMSAVERVTWFLLMMARQQNVEHDAPLHLPMTRLDIADYLGLTIETVSRTFSQLRKTKMIEVKAPSQVRITNWNRFEEVAEGLL